MKIFITGGTGFIGSHLVELLVRRQHELMLLVRSSKGCGFDEFAGKNQIKLVAGDLSDIAKWQGSLRDFKPDALLHLAWEALPDYSEEVCGRNLRYGEDLFTAAAQAGCDCILSAGSCWEYKKTIGRLNEDAEIELSQPFPAAKNTLRHRGEIISNKYGIRFYWPRIFFVYGPGQKNDSLIPYTICSFRNKQAPAIKNPNSKNDFIYVKDAAEAIVQIVEKSPDRMIYNIGSGRSNSVCKIIPMVYQLMQCEFDLPEELKKRSDCEGDNFWADITRIHNDLGWSPKYSLEKGIADTVRHYAAYVEVNEKHEFTKG